MTQSSFVHEIKELIINSLKLDKTPDEIADDAPLFGSGLGLDSIDALELAVAILASEVPRYVLVGVVRGFCWCCWWCWAGSWLSLRWRRHCLRRRS